MTKLGATELARLLGVGRRTVTGWLSGAFQPSPLAQRRLDELGVVVREEPPGAAEIQRPWLKARPKRRRR